MTRRAALPLASLALALATAPAPAQQADGDGLVRITPLGGQEGEFCARDRAMVLEDPDGTRILYDAGRTVAGTDDPRLGEIDVVLVSHMHGDHVGDRYLPEVDAGTCETPDHSVSALPDTLSVMIAVDQGATMLTGSEMASFFASKVEAAGGDPGLSQLVRFGASKSVGGVSVTTVPAVHSNGISGDIVGGELGEMLKQAGLTAHAGPPTGYVVTFSNGLSVYLSGDTGITAEQEIVVARHYATGLAVINIGDTFTTGPEEAAWVIDELVKPASVIPSHANEAATQDGELLPGTKTEAFVEAVETPVHLPLSGRTMGFAADGTCAEGCGEPL